MSLAALFTLIDPPAAAASGLPRQPAQAPELRAAEERLTAALIAKDTGAFERLLAPDFLLRGTPDVARSTWIDNARKLCWGDSFDISDFHIVRSSEDLAIVTLVLTTNRDPTTCERAIVRSLLTDVWRRDEGEWRLILRHSGPAGGTLDVQFAKMTPPPPLFEWSAEVSLVSTGGNSDTQSLGVGGSLIWRPRQWTTHAQTSFLRSEAFDVETARSLVAAVRQARRITPRVDAFGRFEYLVNQFAGIEDRITIDAGLGYRIVEHPVHRLRLDVGFGYSHEARLADDDVSAALTNVGSLYTWRLHRTATIENGSMLTASLAAAEDWRFRNTFSASATMTQLFSLRLSHELKYVHVPVPGFEPTDRILSAALVARF